MFESSAQRQSEFSSISQDVRWLNESIRQGLKMLSRAQACARDVDRDIWQFAIEISTLRKLGLSASELRWMLCKQIAEHREEITESFDSERRYQAVGQLNLSRRSCFVITILGERFLGNLEVATENDVELTVSFSKEPCTKSIAVLPASIDSPIHVPASNGTVVPEWDAMRHELRFGGTVVKRFKHRSPNQEAVLAAFQEEGWPYKIDDPLPPSGEGDPKRRLNDTIKGLNHHQYTRSLRFHGDGTGEGIVWEKVEQEKVE